VNPHSLHPEPAAVQLELNRWHRWAARDRFPLYAAIVLAAAFLIGWGASHIHWPKTKRYEVTANIGPPPPVEPFLLKNIDKDTAKKVNDAVALTKSAVPAAKGFVFSGSSADFDRAIDCLAATIYYEAGAETISGQMAVVQVVLNRVRHPAYPKTVCGVVFQGQERRTGCQFSYTCDGSIARRRPSAEAWARHRGLAQAMLKGLVYPPVGLATHYHTDWVLPAWSARLDKVRVEGTHLFFRYFGYWGTPAAFNGRIGRTEPAFAKMAGLSLAHGSAAAALAEGELPKEIVDQVKLTEMMPPDLERVSTTLETEDKNKEVFLIYVDPLLDSSTLTSMAENACGARKTCKVFAWTDQALIPRGLPLESGDRASMAFSYIRTGSSKGANQKWNCALFPRDAKGQCI
jgi:spore germination cell wall hydrolase CwlJ-like protein